MASSRKYNSTRPIIRGRFTLQKYPGKGGWTYALLKGSERNGNRPFGWKCVRGTVDGAEIKKYHLMPVKSGGLFFPISAAIRKRIGKEAGDTVNIELFPDDDAVVLPPALELCLEDDPGIKQKFLRLTEGQKRMFANWMSKAKTPDTQARRIAVTLDKIQAGKKFQDK